MVRYAIIMLALLGLCFAAHADIDGSKIAKKNAVYSFTAFTATDTTATIDLAGAGDSFAFMFTVSGYLDSIFIKYETSLDGTNWIAYAEPDTITANGTFRNVETYASTMKYVRFIAESDSTFGLSLHWKPGE